MANYIDDISTEDFIYVREITVTELLGEDHIDLTVKLSLNSSNFNFELANSDGSDLRVSEGSNGTRVLNIWIAYWNTTTRIATIWLKIPSLLANETKTLYVFWGDTLADAPDTDYYTKYLLHMDDVGFSDSSYHQHLTSQWGTVVRDNIYSVFGGYSAYFDGTCYITTGDSVDWTLTTNFTIDFRIRFENFGISTEGLCGISEGGGTTRKWGIYVNYSGTDTISFHKNSPTTGVFNVIWSWSPLNNVWYHVAIVRDGIYWYLFIDGLQTGGTQVESGVIDDVTSDLRVGADGEQWMYLHGWMDEFRLSNGIARWTSDFTIPTSAYESYTPTTISGVSDVDSIGFIFADGFDIDELIENIALNKTTSQSSTNDAPASNAVDGNFNTVSYTYQESGAWWKVDLGEVYPIEVIRMTKNWDNSPNYFYIQSADDWDFTVNVVNLITENNQNTQDLYYYRSNFGTLSTRYLRVLCHTNSQYIRLEEFSVYYWSEKWSKFSTADSSGVYDSKLRLETNNYVTTKGNPLDGLTDWIVEEGLSIEDSSGDASSYSNAIYFYGTENDFDVRLYTEGGSYDVRSNVVDGSTYVNYTGEERGLEKGSYSENSLAYDEYTDKLYVSMTKRNTYSDYTFGVERQVYGDTRPTYFRLYGRSGSDESYGDVEWIVIREFSLLDEYSFNTDSLFVTWEQVDHQNIDWAEYGSDITSTEYYHYSSHGGDPYQLSDNATGSTSDCWYSNTGVVATSGIELIIDFAMKDNLVSEDYIHYDSGHVGWLNASKLSERGEDVWGHSYFQGTTTSGYMCIDFGYNKTPVSCMAVLSRSTSGGMIKEFVFEGGNTNPLLSDDNDWYELYSGIFYNTLDWQPIYFTNGTPYRYYRLRVLSTYNDDPIALREWEMYEYFEAREKKFVSQLRLRPITLDSGEIYFPKAITLEGSNDQTTWDFLITETDTYTPFYDYVWGRWQRYSFTNTRGYYRYRLTCYGTWNSTDTKMGIAEWEMVQLESEEKTHRILDGGSNYIQQIWATDETTFDNGFIYIVTSNTLNTVFGNKLAESNALQKAVLDLNVIGD